MTTREILLKQLEAVYVATAANTEGMTHEDSLVQPAEAGNCANWILSHLVYYQNRIMELLDADPVWENDRLAAPRSAPTVSSDAIPWDALRERFLGSRDRCIETLSRMSDDALTEEVPGLAVGVTTRAELLGSLAFHQAYHVGQLGLVRRIAGLDGAIQGPAPRESAASRVTTSST